MTVEEQLAAIYGASEKDAAMNYRVMDNHLLHSDRVIANKAAIATIDEDSATTAALVGLLENPTQHQQSEN